MHDPSYQFHIMHYITLPIYMEAENMALCLHFTGAEWNLA